MFLTRRLLVALLLACSAVVALGAPALAACPAGNPSLERQVMDADAVFTGTVADRQKVGRAVVYTVAVDRIYKGDVADEATVRTAATARACGLPDLERDGDYVFFASGGDRLTTTRQSGTAPATDARVARIERMLGDGRPATPPAPLEATFTTVADGRASLERMAAPGVALVLVGLLGLVLVAALGRRRG